ncbi:glycosyltransferase [Escherichia coli]|nr:glycosyltransferase [Escherichia coli]EFN7708029.1 glycosyltransferase [Escherichia coli]EHX0117224.1 glycosyltransferase [Escherichia coli]EJC7913043.1 glycosyltransferase [Escherichia coli]ELW4698262.1 glycosyltransferase [Escherichia coli]
MRKILVLTPRFPYPVIGGDRLRIYKICEYLSKYFDLTLLSLCEKKEEINMDIDDSVFKEIHRIYLPKFISYINTIISVPTSTPLQVAYYKSYKYKKKLEELLPKHDAVFAHLIRTGDYVKNKDAVKILEMTDAISLNYKRVRQNSITNFRSFVYSIEQKRLEHYEKSMSEHFDLLSLISPIDKEFLFKDKMNVKVYGNGVDANLLPFYKREIQDKNVNLIFIGNMHSLQNMDAVLWFAKYILPKIKVKGKNVILKIIGRIKEVDEIKLSKYTNVKIIGAVNNVADASLDGHIGICPIRLGAGVQNKILEYMALGLPCITSSVGYEGIGALNKENILIADTIDEYNHEINALVYDKKYYNFIAINARKFVEAKYSWSAKLESMISDVTNLIEK